MKYIFEISLFPFNLVFVMFLFLNCKSYNDIYNISFGSWFIILTPNPINFKYNLYPDILEKLFNNFSFVFKVFDFPKLDSIIILLVKLEFVGNDLII